MLGMIRLLAFRAIRIRKCVGSYVVVLGVRMKSEGGTVLRIAKLAFLELPTFAFASAQVSAQQAGIAPEILERMAKEKDARRTCKIEICAAFAKPAAGSTIT